ncbi:MAG: CHAT domain-containing protein [Saprospiraceae bacterium]|nr:CHAT domain-containing protein [Saprospiraceae bacterium]
MNDIDTIYFSPSGLLHQISFAAIKKLDGSFLGDEYYLQQVHSTGILTQPEIAKEIRNIAIFGGMDYEAEEQEISKSIANINKDVDYVSRGLYVQDSTRNGKWSYLPGTKKEAENIYNISKNANLTTKLFMGAEAIEEQYKNLDGDKSPSILHIATHGFFFPDPKISKEKLERLAFHTDNPFTIADNPMNRSGLLFSGSNKAWVGDSISLAREDGILTAYERQVTPISKIQNL